ncbi:MAG: MBL fold metallo-hydrolase [Candidatus Thorarchaeota archaeon]
MNIISIEGKGLSSNCFIISNTTKDKVIIIDLGLNGQFTNFKLKKELMTFAKNDFEIPIEVFLTHCHLDHILGFDNLSDFKNVTYSSSQLTAQHINSRDAVTLLSMFSKAKIEFTVTKQYSDEEILPLNGEEIMVLHTPGHTDGSACLYDKKEKALFAGDLVFAGGGVGRVDLPTGNQKVILSSLEKLTKMDIQHLYSGHGPNLHSRIRENILLAKQQMESW